MVEDCLGIVFDTEEVMKTWLEMLISCQMGGRSIEGIHTFSFFHIFFLFQKKPEPTPVIVCNIILVILTLFHSTKLFGEKKFQLAAF